MSRFFCYNEDSIEEANEELESYLEEPGREFADWLRSHASLRVCHGEEKVQFEKAEISNLADDLERALQELGGPISARDHNRALRESLRKDIYRLKAILKPTE